MKKLLILILTVLMLISSASCSITVNMPEGSENALGGLTGDIAENGRKDTESLPKEDTSVPSVDDTAEVPSEDSAAGSPSSEGILRGNVDGNVYSSTTTGITFTKPDSWVYYTDEEISTALNNGLEILDSGAYSEEMLNMLTVYDMMVMDYATGTNISIAYENLKLTGSEAITEAEYIEAVKSQIAAAAELSYEFGDATTVTLCGNEYHCLTANANYLGISMTQVYYLRKLDGYMNNIIVTILGDYTIEDIEAMFG